MSGFPVASGIVLATLIFLVVDTYPVVKCFRASFLTISFWLLWIIFSTLNIIAFGAIKIAAGDKIGSLVGIDLRDLTLVLLATFGTVGIMQSLCVKVADYKFIDVGSWVDRFRAGVLEDILKKSASQDRLFAMKVAGKLAVKYANNAQGLRDEYAVVMSFGGQTTAQIGEDLANLAAQAAAANLSLEGELARRIAQADIERAKKLV